MRIRRAAGSTDRIAGAWYAGFEAEVAYRKSIELAEIGWFDEEVTTNILRWYRKLITLTNAAQHYERDPGLGQVLCDVLICRVDLFAG